MAGFDQLEPPTSEETLARDRLMSDVSAPDAPDALRPASNAVGTEWKLPALELVDPAAWTVAVDLTSDLILPDGTDVGGHHELSKLEQLVEASKGQPDVAIAVQAAGSRSREQLPTNGTGQQQDVQLDRYIIRDGQLTKVETVDSQGIQENQTGLLQFATQFAPSDHIGLVIQSHGGGADGLVGGTGEETLAQLNAAVKAGLTGSGHERLDLLDFDACSMASAATLGAVTDIADQVVASELRERASKNFDGQNLNAILTNLLQNPQLSPEDLAKTFVQRANEGVTPEVLQGDPFKHAGADVLSSYDSSQYGQFSNALNALGVQLTHAVTQDAAARSEIEQLIDETSELPGGQNFPERRDLREFVQSVKAAADSGELRDDDGAISRAATQLLDAQTNLTGDTQTVNAAGYDQLGGMYVFLPVQAVREGSADGPDGLHHLEQIANREPRDRNQTVDALEIISNEIAGKLSDDALQQFQPVIDAVNTIKNAKSDADFRDALRALGTVVKPLLASDVEQELIDNLIHREDVPQADQWNEFTHVFGA